MRTTVFALLMMISGTALASDPNVGVRMFEKQIGGKWYLPRSTPNGTVYNPAHGPWPKGVTSTMVDRYVHGRGPFGSRSNPFPRK